MLIRIVNEPVILEDFDKYLRLARLADSTKETYRYWAVEFQRWALENNLAFPTITALQMMDWLDSHRGWSSSTRYGAINAVRSYYVWKYGRMHDVSANAKITRKKDAGPQRSLEWYQLDKLLQYFDGSPKGIRDKALIALLVDTGLREAEVCRADLANWNTDKRQIGVLIKGNRWDTAEYFQKTAEYLSAWMEVRASVARPGVRAIFVSIGGNKPGTRLTTGGLRAVFRWIGQKAGLGAFSPHDCRRTMATLAARAGAPSVVIQHAGRWSNLEMVNLYTRNLKPSDLRPFSPMDNLDSNT